MRSIFTLFMAMAVINFGFAQPVISNVIPNFGDQILQNQADGALDPGASGENVTWDLSSFAVDEYSANYVVKAPGDVEGSDQFPDATVVWAIDMVFMQMNAFMSFADNKFTDYGVVTTSSGVLIGRTYDDPEVHFKHPLNYLDTGSDTYSGIVSSVGTESNVSGETSYVVDGYGTLITPYGTYENTLRITTTKVETLTVLGTEQTSDITETSWYSQDFAAPIYVISSIVDSYMGTPLDSSKSSTVLVDYIKATGVDKIEPNAMFEIYPNPASDYIVLNAEMEGEAEIKVFSTDGKLVINKRVQKHDRIAVHNLSSGYYTAMLIVDGKHYKPVSFVVN